MTEPDAAVTVATPGPDDAAARHEDGRYINHETGQPYEGADIPEPVPGALPWTNADVRAMVEGRPPRRPQPWTEPASPPDEQRDPALASVPAPMQVDTGATPINLTPDGVNHFKRIIGDEAKCGGCGAQWPCDHAVGIKVGLMQEHAAGLQAARLQAAAALMPGRAPHGLVGEIGPS